MNLFIEQITLILSDDIYDIFHKNINYLYYQKSLSFFTFHLYKRIQYMRTIYAHMYIYIYIYACVYIYTHLYCIHTHIYTCIKYDQSLIFFKVI